MCEKFKRYDPAKMDLWEDCNRPWDYDHIIPQDWIHKSYGRMLKYTGYCMDWKDNNGNMAAIPFWINRSKSNQNDWEEYIKNKKELLVDDVIESYQKLNSDLTQNDEQAYLFADNTYKRLCRIYKEIYELLEPVDVKTDGSLSDDIEIGLRRLPESSELSGNVTEEFVDKVNKGSVQYEKCEGSWWHIYSIIKSRDTSDEQIVDYLNELAVLAEKEL